MPRRPAPTVDPAPGAAALRAARARADLTLDQLGARVGLSKQALSAMERGREVPTAERALALGKALGVHPREIRPDLPWPG